VVAKMSTETDPWNTAVSTVATAWKAYQRWDPAHPVTAPAMVVMWRRMKRRPTTEGRSLRERVRKMQLEAAPRRM